LLGVTTTVVVGVAALITTRASATPASLRHLPAPPRLHTPAGALFDVLATANVLPAQRVGEAFLRALRQFPTKKDGWTAEAQTLFRGCVARASVESARVVQQECRSGGCAFVVETSNEAEQQRLFESFARGPGQESCSGATHGRLGTRSLTERDKSLSLHIYLAPFEELEPIKK
jgi:hypothetical protein